MKGITAKIHEDPGSELPPANPGAKDIPLPSPASVKAEYEVVIVGGGPAGLSAAALCAKKTLQTAVFEEERWGGILTRYCPDKRIDNYPGTTKGILAGELAALLVDDALESGANLFLEGVEEIGREGFLRTGNLEVTGKVMILACGSTTAEARIPGERILADAGLVHYKIPDPSLFLGMRVVVVGGGDTAISHVQRLLPFAEHVTLIHRKPTLRSIPGIPEEMIEAGNLTVLLGARVEKILGSFRMEGIQVRTAGEEVPCNIPADAVIVGTGRVPNSISLRNLGLRLDSKGHVVTDERQRTSQPGILAIGDLSSQLKMIVTAVAQAAVASQEAYTQIRKPYWKE
jgi:thioredoxin reductase (NADPH)